NSIHRIPQAKFLADIQTEVSGSVTRLASSIAMIRRSYRTLIEDGTCTAYGAVEDGKTRTISGIVSAQRAIIYGTNVPWDNTLQDLPS
ncbi:MAG: hypothetical protein ACYDHW_17045, partial [Syntrophorhabdaceae bacterium]